MLGLVSVAMRGAAEIGAADTLCLARVVGERFTRARKAGAMAMNALTILFGVVVIPPTDASRVVLTCYETATGKYLWSSLAGLGDPEEPNGAFLKLALNYFPKKGETLSPQCVADESKPTELKCQRRDADKPNTSAIASASPAPIAAK